MTVYDPPNPSCPIHGARLQRSTCAKCNAAYMRRYLKVQRRATPAVALHSRARQRATRRGLPFDLDVSDVVVPSICPALGVPLVIGEVRSPYSPSLDRIRPALGYVGDLRLAEVDKGWIRDLRDLWAPRGHKATNDRVQVLKNALTPAVEDGRIKTNPFLGLRKLTPPHDADEANLAWTDEEVDAFIALALQRNMPGLARAVALGRWGGFRRGTICNIPLNARVIALDDNGLSQRRLYWTTEKRKVLCDKREDSRLSAFLEGTPAKALTIAYDQRGHPWKERSLSQAVARLIDTLALTKRARPNLTPHGLRHARGLELAYAGASDAEIMAQLEHTTERAARIYRRQAERRRMADSGQDRVDNVVALKAERRRSSNGA